MAHGNGSWLPGEGIPELLKKYKNPVGIEIGSDHGWTTEYLLDVVDGLVLHTVDPYTAYIDWNGSPADQSSRTSVYDGFKNRIKRFGDRNIHHELTSDDAASNFEDESIDFIFIDGIHTYEQVTLDCNNYYSKIKKGGLITGHDYNAVKGVKKAVDEFAAKVGKEVKHTQQDVWYWYKD